MHLNYVPAFSAKEFRHNYRCKSLYIDATAYQ